MRHDDVANVIRAFDGWIVRAYCWGRFTIIRQRFLDEIGQYLPASGRVLDLGCGFGLFSLYYASVRPGLTITGIDLNGARIGMARAAAAKLHLNNVQYGMGNAAEFCGDQPFDAIYMLDIIHHLPPAAVQPLLAELARTLAPHGRLIVKDVDTTPAYKRWFTHLLDWAMDPRAPVRYWPADELQALIEAQGFIVYRHAMVDVLPYPHVLYVCEKRA